jgi:hypothetical protein
MSNRLKKQQARMTRRQALAACGAGLASPWMISPLHTLVGAIMDGMIAKADAADAVIAPRTLINYHVVQGPAPWYSILPMSPYANISPLRGPHMNTSISNGQLIYKTKGTATSGGTLYMPNLWASNVATPSGSTPMAGLLENMLIMRGVQGNSNQSHAIGAREMTRPVGTRPSIMGLVADASALPVQGVLTCRADGMLTAFKSEKSGQTLVTDFGNPMTQILGAFDKRQDSLNSTFVTRRQAKDALIQQALASLGAYASSNAPGAENLFSMRHSAELFLANGISAAIAAYPVALAKYKKLISDCGSLSALKIVGLTDNAIALPTAGTAGVEQTAISGMNGTYAQNGDVGTIITGSTYPNQMAENFAIAEVLVTLNLSSSITIGEGGIHGMNYQSPQKFDTGAAVTPDGYWNTDEHEGGTYTSLIANSFLYQCLYSCINELISVLKAKNQFNETVIFVTSDFGRSEDSGARGTKHACEACVFQVFSGAIAKSSVLGNISHGASGGDYGQNRPVAGIVGGTRSLTVNDAASSIAKLARVTSPADNFSSLIAADGTPLVETAKEVA